MFEGDFGKLGLNVQGKAFQFTNISPVTDVNELNDFLDLDVLFEEYLQAVIDLDQNLIFSEFAVLHNGELSDVDPSDKDLLDLNAERELEA